MNNKLNKNVEKELEELKNQVEALKQRNEELKHNEKKYRTLFRTSDEGIIIIKNKKIIDCNNKASKLFECKNDKLQGKLIYSLFTPGKNQSHNKSMDLRINSAFKGNAPNFEWKFKTYKNNVFYGEISLKSFTLDGENYIQALIRDITDRKNIEIKLDEYREKLEETVEDRAMEILQTNEMLIVETIEKLKAEEALREKEIHLKTIFDTAINIAFILTDAKEKSGKIIEFSPGAEQIFGYSRENIIGQQINVLHKKENHKIFTNLYEQIIKSKEPLTGETEYIRKNGDIFHGMYSSHPIYNQDNELEAILSVVLNITERKKTEQALRESEERFRMLAENVPGVIYLSRDEKRSKIVYLSDWIEKITGINKNEFINNTVNFNTLIHPNDCDRVNERIKTSVKNKVPFQLQYRITAKNNEYRWLNEHGTPIFDSNTGDMSYIEGFIIDITEQQYLKQEFEQLYATQQIILENNSFGIAFIKESVFEWINIKATELFGKSMQNIQGWRIEDVFENQDVLDKIAKLNTEKIKGKSSYEFETQFIKPDGTKSIFRFVGVAFDPWDYKNGIIWTIEDITERKVVEAALRESEENFRDLAENIQQVFWLNLNGRIIYINPVFETIWEIPLNKIYQSPELFTSLIIKPDKQNFIKKRKKFENKKFIKNDELNTEFRIKTKNNKIKWIWVRIFKVSQEKDKLKTAGIAEDITERKRSEEIMRSYQFAVDNAAETILWISPHGQIHYANKAASDFLGYTNQELTDLNIMKIDIEMDSKKWKKQWQEIRQRRQFRTEAYYRSKDLWVFPVEISVNYLKFGGNEYNCAYIRDISNRKLAETERQYRINRISKQQNALLNIAKSETFGMDSDITIAIKKVTEISTEVLEVERAGVWLMSDDKSRLKCADLYEGTSKKHYFGDMILCDDYPMYFKALNADLTIDAHDALIDPRTSEFAENYLEPNKITSMLDASIRISGEITGVIRFEHTGDFRLWSNDEKSFAGKLADFLAQALSNFERINVEKKLRESQALLQGVINNSPSLVTAKNKEGRILVVNERMASLLGMQSSDIIGKTDYEILPDEIAHNRYVTDQRVIKTGNVVEREELFPHGDTMHTYLAIKFPLYDENNNIFGIGGVSTDITRLKQVEEELRSAKEDAVAATNAKSEFLANMSHEIRTPMNAIVTMTGLALNQKLSPKVREYLDIIDSSSKTLLNIINEILDFSKIEAGMLKIDKISFSLFEILEHVGDIFRTEASDKGIEIIITVDKNVPVALIGDPLRINQIIINIVSNAVKFTQKGEVVIKVESVIKSGQNAKILFSVTDTGIGIEAEKMKNLFDAFTQADGSITRKFGGTGLGLAICKRLVSLMGGEIWAKSTQGKGTTFKFTLTLSRQPEENEPHTIVPLEIDNLRVLVVDDNHAARQAISYMLTGFSFDVYAVSSAEEAIKELKTATTEKNEYGLVIMDWLMKGIDGITATEKIKNDKTIPDTPIILTTMFGKDQEFDKATQVGINGFLFKPIKQSLLFDTIISIFFEETEIELTKKIGTITRVSLDKKAVKGAYLLVAEDNKINQKVALEVLSEAGIYVHIVNNGNEVLKAIENEDYDAILLDVQMPVLDGIRTTQAIRNDKRFKNLPIIAMTANAMKGDREKYLKAGMNDYIAKPINTEQLFSVLRNWVVPKERPELEKKILKQREKCVFDTINFPVELDGINVNNAVARLAGNKKLFLRLLKHFARDNIKTGEEIANAIEKRQYNKAQEISHALKGVAGNIGAEKVYESAKELNDKLKKGVHKKLNILVDKISKQLDIVLNSIIEVIKQREKIKLERNDYAPLDVERVIPILKEMYDYCKNFDPDADTLLDELKGLLENTFYSDEYDDLEESIEMNNFEQALDNILTMECKF